MASISSPVFRVRVRCVFTATALKLLFTAVLILSGPPAELTASDQPSCVARVFPPAFSEKTQQP